MRDHISGLRFVSYQKIKSKTIAFFLNNPTAKNN